MYTGISVYASYYSTSYYSTRVRAIIVTLWRRIGEGWQAVWEMQHWRRTLWDSARHSWTASDQAPFIDRQSMGWNSIESVIFLMEIQLLRKFFLENTIHCRQNNSRFTLILSHHMTIHFLKYHLNILQIKAKKYQLRSCTPGEATNTSPMARSARSILFIQFSNWVSRLESKTLNKTFV